MRAFCGVVLGVLSILVFCGVVSGGGSAEDYARADRLHGLTRGKVMGAKLEANWLGGGRMWYRAHRGGGAYEYVLVDAEKGDKRVAFDHERLADAFGAAGEAGVRADRLGIDGMKFGPRDEWVEFARQGKVWRCDLDSYEVDFVRYDSDGLLRAMEPGNGPDRSGGSGRESNVVFVNCMDWPVELFWLDMRGERQSYGKLGPGEQREQHTYQGHVWLVADESGEAIAKYVARGEHATALIGKNVPVDDKQEQGERRARRDRAVSPDGNVGAFVREHNVWIKFTDGGEEVQLSNDGTEDWPYTGEFFFSPDSRKLVVMRTKKGQEHKVHMVESSPRDQLQPKLHTVDYHKPGDVLPVDRPYLFDLAKRAGVPVSNELFENPWSITRLVWDDDSGRFTFVYNQRGHQVLRVVGVDAETGSAEAIVDERSDTFICYSSKMYYKYLQKTGEMIWMSERNGWNHLYLYNANTGAVKNRITGSAPRHMKEHEEGQETSVNKESLCNADVMLGPPRADDKFAVDSMLALPEADDKSGKVGFEKDELSGASALRLPRGFAARNDMVDSVGTAHPTALNDDAWSGNDIDSVVTATHSRVSGDEVQAWIARGEWVVRDVVKVDEAKRQILFTAGGIWPGQDPYYVHYVRVNFDGTGLTVLTEGDGTHEKEFSPDGKYFVDSYSRVDMPGVHELRRSKDGGLVCELERADWNALLETGWQAPERFAAKGRDGETDIYGVIWKPTNFDASKKYPVIESIYAGPHGFFTPKSFRSYYGQQKLAELGFIVIKCDGMGTNGRSKAFHDVCWKNLKDSGFPDRIAWTKAAAKDRPWMDLSRVGIYGGSAGGQSAACAVMTHGDFYDVAVADCGCHDNRMDKIWWNEQWMGWPVDESYAANSNVTLAKGLAGKLMLTVGELDRNVDPASTMQVVDALIRADKDFDMLVFPGGGHGAGESAYGQRRRADYFVRHLMGVEPRR